MAALCRLEGRSLPFKLPLELTAGHLLNICVHPFGGKVSVLSPSKRRGRQPGTVRKSSSHSPVVKAQVKRRFLDA